jgi:hypothetical protein
MTISLFLFILSFNSVMWIFILYYSISMFPIPNPTKRNIFFHHLSLHGFFDDTSSVKKYVSRIVLCVQLVYIVLSYIAAGVSQSGCATFLG